MKVRPLLLGSMCIFFGCASTEEVRQSLITKSDRALCMEYMTLPTLNLHQSARESEIKRRGIDCWQYGNVTEERRKADTYFKKKLDDTTNSISRRPQPTSPPSINPREGEYWFTPDGKICSTKAGITQCVR